MTGEGPGSPAERALRESEERFRLLVTASSQRVYRMSADWSRMLPVVGDGTLADTDAPGFSWLDRYIPDCEKAVVQAAIDRAIRGKAVFELEHRVLQKDGTVGWTLSRAIPVLGPQGEITEWFGAASDITERRQHAEALLESEEKYRTLFDTMVEGFSICGVVRGAAGQVVDLHFLELNHGLETQTGLDRRTTTGRRFSEVFPKLDVERWLPIYAAAIDTGEPKTFEEYAVMLGRHFEVSVYPRRGDQLAIFYRDITGRRRTETALLESTQRLRTVLDGIGDFFYALDADWRLLFASRSALTQWGRSADEVLGRSFLEAFPQAPGSATYEAHRRVMRTGVAERLETVSLVTGRWTELDLAPTPQGGLSVAFRDIHTRRQAEGRQAFLLRLSDALRPLTESAEIERVATRLLGRELGANRVFYARVDASGETWSVESDYADGVPSCAGRYFMSAFQQKRLVQWRAGQMSSVSDSDTDSALDDADRSAYAAFDTRAVIGVPLVKGGRFVALMSVNHRAPHVWSEAELTLTHEVAERIWVAVERARAEEALQFSEERFRTVANLVPDLLWESEPDGFTNWYNQRWLEYTGQTFVQATGWGWADAIHPSDREASARQYREGVELGLPLRQEHRIRGQDGEYRWFVVNVFPLKDERGEVVKMYGAATDIHALRMLTATLEARVDERTRRLADLNAELGNLITRTAHTLEEPARQLSHLLEPSAPGGAQPPDHQPTYDPVALSDEVKRLKGVARDLRQLSVLEEQPFNKEPLPLGELFAEVSGTPPGNEVTWQVAALPIVRGDRALLRQALEVLMTFTLSETRGAQYVTVSSREIEGEVQVSVQDDGIGLSGEEAATLFDLAVRTEHAVPVLEGGGLIQVRRILARHGGWAWAESQRSSGKVVLAFPRDAAVTEFEALFRQDRPGM